MDAIFAAAGVEQFVDTLRALGIDKAEDVAELLEHRLLESWIDACPNLPPAAHRQGARDRRAGLGRDRRARDRRAGLGSVRHFGSLAAL